jgi:SpoVK/Ycf46/Vps4 family AAA+-type ATPase
MINKQSHLFSLLLFSVCFNHSARGTESARVLRPEIVIDGDQDLIDKKNALKKQADLKAQERDKRLKEVKEADVALYNESYAQAPIEVKDIVDIISSGDELASEYKHILLTGPTGSGKTILAQAIAYKLGRKCLVIEAPSLLGHYRDQAAENIRKLFKDLSEYEEKPILIIDEVNILADGYTSEHGDKKDTASQFWTLLDKFEGDRDFFLIGTSNSTKKMPHQLQGRFEGQTFIINNPSFESRKRTIEFYLKKLNATRDESCSDAYLIELCKKIENFSQRSIKALIKVSLVLFHRENPKVSPKKLSKKHLEQAYKNLMQVREKLWDFSDPTTDEERRHRESLAQNKRQYEDSKETQLRTMEFNSIFQALLAAKTAGGNSVSLATTIGSLHKALSKTFPNRKLDVSVDSRFFKDDLFK